MTIYDGSMPIPNGPIGALAQVGCEELPAQQLDGAHETNEEIVLETLQALYLDEHLSLWDFWTLADMLER